MRLLADAPEDFYTLLGIDASSNPTPEAIKAAYRKLQLVSAKIFFWDNLNTCVNQQVSLEWIIQPSAMVRVRIRNSILGFLSFPGSYSAVTSYAHTVFSFGSPLRVTNY